MTDLDKLLKRGVEQVRAMTEDERQEMWREQARGVAKAEMSWPAPKYKFINGVKVYASYEDYCND